MSWLSGDRDPAGPVITDHAGTHRIADVVAAAQSLRSSTPEGGRVALTEPPAIELVQALIGLEGWADEVALLPAGRAVPVPEGFIAARGPMSAADRHEPRINATGTKWILCTSGTTGTPKRIAHTHASLTRTIRVNERSRQLVWGLLYEPYRMAGIQVLAQGLLAGGHVVVPSPSESIGDRIEFMRAFGVTALSATPTVWRQILQCPSAVGWPLAQVTLGGELADQLVLDALKTAFPRAHVTHVFASTETGAAFAIGDGRAGFPVDYLTQAPRGVRLQIRDGILHVHSPHVEGADDDGFASTGDLVMQESDRVLFLGRASGAVNVGGAKVMPEDVEVLLRSHPEVAEALVRSKANPFSGEILTAQVVAIPSAPADLGRRLRAWIRESAPNHYVPATITVVEHIQVNKNGKVIRNG